MADFDVVVIGAGPAAALRAAELGARVAVVEATRTGGTCVNTGCVPTRVLARTARLVREVRTAREYGILVEAPAIVEVVQSVTTAMAAGIDVSTLVGVRFAYPTYSAVIGLAARRLLASGSSVDLSEAQG